MQRTLCALSESPVTVGEAFLGELSDCLPVVLREPASELRTSPLPSASECPSEDDILRFTAGELAEAQIRRIDQHLDVCSSCSCVVTDMLGELADRSETHARFPRIPCVFSPSTRIANRFVIEQMIGRGGMGEVYRAKDLRREVTIALKTVVAAHSDSRTAMRRLAHELHATRKIDHPNVCRAHGTGVHRDGAPSGPRFRFIVMDYIEGESLGQHIRRLGALPLPRALRVARQVLLGLQAIHRAGVVHLDVKSDNVMLREGPVPQAVLIDFGLARTSLGGAHRPGRSRSPEGTASCMAPEQLSNRSLGPYTDIFGFGVLFYELLTGNHPIVARRPSSLHDRTLQRDELPLRPSRASSAVHAAVCDFVAGCTNPDPADRYPDATAALRQFDLLVS